ncbi:MAG: Gfo/Idh/MocA family oxidoreductase [Defluviitaleaceae bacterium]|nr:Gfo/Idh/MocA family oxidoreductase [Defluviitaleaceae bacterium]
MFKAAIAGCGAIAPLHADAIKKLGFEIAAVCDPCPERAAAYSCPAYPDYQTLVDAEKGRIDVMHICLPHYLHAPAAIYAMKRGIHVLCEKPMAIHMKEAEAMIKTARDHDVTLGVIFQNRYNPGSQLVKNALSSGTLGKVQSGWLKVTWHRDEKYYTESGWRGQWSTEGGGVLINQSIHTFDLANYLLGGVPDYVEASISNRAHPAIEVEDVTEGVITYGDVKVSFYANTIHPYDAPVMLELICEKGRATLTGDTARIEYNHGQVETADPAKDITVPHGTKSYWGISHARQIKAFYESLAKGERPEIDGTEAIKTQRLICGIYQSAKTGKRVDF